LSLYSSASAFAKDTWLPGLNYELLSEPGTLLGWLGSYADSRVTVEIEGRRYSHIVDPRTGLGITDHSLVTVIGRDGITCDALSTAISVAGPDRALALARHFGAEVLLVRMPGTTLEGVESSGFKRWSAR